MSRIAYAGVDGGGTKTAIVLVDADGAEIGRHTTSTSNAAVIGHDAAGTILREGLQAALAATGSTLGGAWFGLSGSDRPEDHRKLRPHLADLTPSIHFTNDAEMVLAAFPDGAGLVVVAGTGSIAFGRGIDGQRARAGGWGQLLGDEGSGYDLARRMLMAFTAQVDSRGPESSCYSRIMSELDLAEPFQLIQWVYAQQRTKGEIAALSHIVLTAAGEGDTVAEDIVSESARLLAQTATAAANRLVLPTPLPLALTGGLLNGSSRFRETFLTTFEHHHPAITWQLVTDPALTAARHLAIQASTLSTESRP